MLDLIAIALTIVAWIRGWKGWALVPFGICFFVAVRVELARSTGEVESFSTTVKLLCLIVSIGTFIALVVMIIKKPSS